MRIAHLETAVYSRALKEWWRGRKEEKSRNLGEREPGGWKERLSPARTFHVDKRGKKKGANRRVGAKWPKRKSMLAPNWPEIGNTNAKAALRGKKVRGVTKRPANAVKEDSERISECAEWATGRMMLQSRWGKLAKRKKGEKNNATAF